MDEAALTLRFLGELDIERAGDRPALPPSRKTRALLAYLAVTGRPQRRAHLCSLLWDAADDPRGALRWSLSRLRPLVDAPGRRRLIADGEAIQLDARDVRVDLIAVRRAVAKGVPSLATEELTSLAGAFRGELLEGLDLLDLHDFQAWSVAEREQARSMRAAILGALLDRLRHDPAAALPHARALVEVDPLDDGARAKLLRVLWALRRHQEAEQCFLAGERLRADLGARTTGELRRAWDACREGRGDGTQRTVVLATPPPSAGAPLPATVDPHPGTARHTPPSAHTPLAPQPPSSAHAPLAPQPPPIPFVGRASERAALAAALAGARARRAERVVLLTGEPGIGKTRLVADLASAVHQAGGVALQGAAYEAESGRPYVPWIDALRRVPSRALDTSLRRDLAALLGELPAEAAPERARDRLFDATVTLVASLARDAPAVLLALDDLQWCDAASAELLHYVARKSRDVPLLLVLAARAGELPDNAAALRALRGLRRDVPLDEIRLGPLDRDDVLALAAQLAPGIDPGRVHEESGGNPLFAIEVLRSAPHRRDDLPPTLGQLVRDRLDRLPNEALEALRWGALLGPTFHARDIERLLRLDFAALAPALELLERHHLLREHPDAGEGACAFAHDVVRRAVLADLSGPRRRLMHARVAAALVEREGVDSQHSADVAHHAALGGEAALAARACLAAALRCLRLFALADADALARRGVRHAEGLPEPERVPLLLELHEVGLAARRPVAVDDAARALEGLAERALGLGLRTHARLGFHLLAYLRWDVGAAADARRHMLRAEEVSRATGDAERAVALAEAARCLVLLGRDLARAEALLLEARALARRLSLSPYAISDALGLLRQHEDHLDEAAALFEEARAIAAREPAPLREFEALEHLVKLEQQRGRWEAAAARLPALIELGAKLREGSEAPFALALSALCDHALRRPDATTRLDEALAALREADAKCRLGYVSTWAAAIALSRGDAATARERAEEALRIAVLLERPSDVAWARALLVRAHEGEAADRHRERLAEELSREVSAHVRRFAEAALGERTRSRHEHRAGSLHR